MAKRSKRNKAAAGGIPGKAVASGAITQGFSWWLSRDWFWGLILFLAVILAYSPVYGAGYIWDDDIHLTGNPCIIGPLGLKEIWTTSVVKFCPFVFTTFWLEHAFWGLAPMPYHLVNVLQHGVSSLLLWRVLRSLQVPGAWLGAALWALHPVEVESVAWVSEMKNTESGVFFLLSILFFVHWLKTRELDGHQKGRWNYGLTLLFAFLAMASKSSTVILPVALCLCAWWVEGRWRWRNLAIVGPVFLFSVIASALTIWSPDQGQSYDPQWSHTLPERVVMVGKAFWFYLGKLLWPYPLSMVYPRWKIDASSWFSYLPLLAAAVALSLLWLKRESWGRPWFFAFAYFLAALLPVLGFLENPIFRFSLVFDHFQYLASMGPLALVGAGLAWLADIVIPQKLHLQAVAGGGVLLILGLLTWNRAWVYEGPETIWTDTLAKNPNCWVGYNNLGDVFLKEKQLDKAMALFQKALAIYPNYDMANNNIGDVLFQLGRMDEAIAYYQKAVAVNPGYVEARNDLGFALCLTGRVDEAVDQYHKALKIDPDIAEIHNNLAYALFKQGEVNEATAEYQKSLEMEPNNAQAHYNFGSVLFQEGKLDDATTQFQTTLELDPTFTQAHDNLGTLYSQKGQLDEAVDQFQEALKESPGDSHAQSGLAKAQAALEQKAALK